MVIYFTGTGNSEYVAKKIAEAVGDEVLNLFDKIKGKDYSAMTSENQTGATTIQTADTGH